LLSQFLKFEAISDQISPFPFFYTVPIALTMSGISSLTNPSSEKVVHDYHDYSHITESHPIMKELYATNAESLKDQNFPLKLYDMLNELEKDGLDHIASWQPHGRCFVVHDPKRFVADILPL
jgi:hypothetical protein